MIIGGIWYFIMLFIAESAKAPETPPEQKAEQRNMGCGALYFILVIFSGLFLLSTDKERNPIFFKVCRTTLLSPLVIILVCIILGIVRKAKRVIEEEAKRLNRGQELRSVREKEERERRAELEKRERFIDNLIATGLFYEDDPWGKLYDDDDDE